MGFAKFEYPPQLPPSITSVLPKKPWEGDYDVVYFGYFGVRPTVRFYDDGRQPNAFATPTAILSDGPDGTILLGWNLFDQLRARDPFAIALRVINLYARVVAAHEFGHIVQYKMGLSPEGPWQMEPHADFMAGWSLSQGGGFLMSEQTSLEESAKAMFEFGDFAFNDRAHHGEPQFRAAMVRAGYELGKFLDVNQAFEKGKSIAGLK